MPDFRIDDTAPEHRKMRAAGIAALGLWSMAGAWSNSPAQMTDGWIPLYWIQTWAGGKKSAERLVKVGLWRTEERNGIPGYQFHDWADFQRTAASWEDEKRKARERMKAVRNRRSTGDGSGERADELQPHGLVTERSTPDSNIDPTHEYVGGTSDVTSPVDNPPASKDNPMFGRTETERAPKVNDSLTLTLTHSGQSGRGSAVPARASAPPPRCPKHLEHPADGPCRACGDARRDRTAWDAERAGQAADAERADRLAIRACSLCDGDGWRWHPDGRRHGTTNERCTHQPTARQEPA